MHSVQFERDPQLTHSIGHLPQDGLDRI